MTFQILPGSKGPNRNLLQQERIGGAPRAGLNIAAGGDLPLRKDRLQAPGVRLSTSSRGNLSDRENHSLFNSRSSSTVSPTTPASSSLVVASDRSVRRLRGSAIAWRRAVETFHRPSRIG